MKKPIKQQPADLELREIASKSLIAERQLVLAKKRLRQAKLRVKQARKALKKAKNAAKELRKKIRRMSKRSPVSRKAVRSKAPRAVKQ